MLAQAGHSDDKGMPKPLRLATLAVCHPDLVYLAGPVWAQRLAFAVMARIARTLGQRPMTAATA